MRGAGQLTLTGVTCSGEALDYLGQLPRPLQALLTQVLRTCNEACALAKGASAHGHPGQEHT
jgi:hypothetical protein